MLTLKTYNTFTTSNHPHKPYIQSKARHLCFRRLNIGFAYYFAAVLAFLRIEVRQSPNHPIRQSKGGVRLLLQTPVRHRWIRISCQNWFRISFPDIFGRKRAGNSLKYSDILVDIRENSIRE